MRKNDQLKVMPLEEVQERARHGDYNAKAELHRRLLREAQARKRGKAFDEGGKVMV